MRLPAWLIILLLTASFYRGPGAAAQTVTNEAGAPVVTTQPDNIEQEGSDAGQAADGNAAPAQPAPPAPVAPRPSVGPAPPTRTTLPTYQTYTPSRAMTSEMNNTARTISLDVRGVNVDVILKILANATGLTFLKDTDLDVQLTIICPRPVSIDEALEILNAELSILGYTTVRQGQVIKVTNFDNAVKMNTEVHLGTDPNAFPPGDRFITQIVPLTTLDASSLSDELSNFSNGTIIPNLATNSLYIIDSATSVQKLLGIINEMEKRSAASVRRFQLRYVAVEDVADLLTNFLTGAGGGGTSGARPTYERRLLPTSRTQPTARPATAPRTTQPTTAGGGGGNGVQVLTDARTNSLIVQASPERLDIAANFLAAIDVPVDYSSTLAVIPLQFARADVLANRLVEALGGTPKTTTTTTPTSSSRNNTSSGYRTPGSTTAAFVPEPNDTNSAPHIILAQGKLDENGNLVLIQNSDTTAVGRTGEGKVVPLVDMADIIIVPDPATGSLIVNASPEKLELIRQLVKKLDVIPTQVLVQAVIAEVSLSKTNQLGIEWSLMGNNTLGTGASDTLSTDFGVQQTDSSGNDVPLLGLTWSVLKGDTFKGLLNAMALDSKVRILSTPKIFTTSGEQAKIDVSTQIPFATGQYTSDTGGVTTSFDYQSVGIVLEVTPTVSQDGMVSMLVSQTADDLLRYEQLSTDLKLPVVAKREVGGTVNIQDGETVVLGGLMQDRLTRSITGIPILKDLPLIGQLFQNRSTVKEKTELLVFLTPHVVRTPEESKMLTNQERLHTNDLKKLPIVPDEPEQ